MQGSVFRRVRRIALLFAALWLALPVAAAEPPFRKSRFVHVAEKQPLAELLRTFGASQGWNVVVSSELEGTVSARFSMSSREFWSMLTSSQNLIWYYDGQFMHVDPAPELRTDIIAMGQGDFRRWLDALIRLEVADTRLAPRYDAKSEVALLSGPPRFIEMARALWQQVESGPTGADGLATRVFPLSSAIAADQLVSVGGQSVRIEGVAAVVRRVMAPSEAAPEGHTAAVASPSGLGGTQAQRLSGLRGQSGGLSSITLGSSDGYSISGAPLRDGAAVAPPASVAPRRIAKASLPRVEADAATNAVIVRDRPDRLHEYQRLIEQLDRARPLVEIEARMVEVEQDELADLGIDLSVYGNRGSLETTSGAVDPALGRSPQIVATLVDGAAGRLLARVRALEGSGRGKLVTTPRLLTLDRTEASIESTETAYVKVAGNLEANLFAVQAGSSLRILPAVLGEPAQRRIRLVVTIEDGFLSDSRVDSVPVVQRQRVFTQSEVAEGASLLVGGLSDVRERAAQEGVPVLSKIPGIGAFFGRKSSSRSSRERLYLITPRIVPPIQPVVAPVNAIPQSDAHP